MPAGVPRENAPLHVRELPDYWDRERERDGKDRSTCAAELRRALLSQFADQTDAAIDDVEELVTIKKRVRELEHFLKGGALHYDFRDLWELTK